MKKWAIKISGHLSSCLSSLSWSASFMALAELFCDCRLWETDSDTGAAAHRNPNEFCLGSDAMDSAP